jgi:hypothetical protein
VERLPLVIPGQRRRRSLGVLYVGHLLFMAAPRVPIKPEREDILLQYFSRQFSPLISAAISALLSL